jgi:hypothetical protein
VSFKYISTSIDMSNEIALVAIGPVTVTVAFAALIAAAALCNGSIGHLPDHISKFISLFGVVAVTDPFIVMLLNVLAQNFDCENRTEACRADYTSAACHCFTGSFVTLSILTDIYVYNV